MLVCTLGDLVLDVIVRLEQPLARGGDATARITIEPGGQAANVAAWVAALGSRACWIGKRADDDVGRIAAERLAGYGVELVGPVAATGNGIVVSLVDPDGQRTMCPDRGAATELRPDEIEPAWLADASWLHISGYALFVEPVRSAALRTAELARAGDVMVSVDLASWSGIRDVGPDRLRSVLAELAPDAVFCNEDEDHAIGGRHGDAAWILKRGPAGCSFNGDERSARPVPRVVDTTGAGDALAAGWLVGGPDLALEAAARCVQQVGSMP
jgi:sugar/nucleoside kinase (ribokinase family)